jgi:hypothetical protein
MGFTRKLEDRDNVGVDTSHKHVNCLDILDFQWVLQGNSRIEIMFGLIQAIYVTLLSQKILCLYLLTLGLLDKA